MADLLHGYDAQLTFDGIWRGPVYGLEIITIDKVIFYWFHHFQLWDHGMEYEKERGADMKAKKGCCAFALCCVAVFVLMLTGCDPTAGATVYEVIYPSGHTRDYLTDAKKIPVEGTSYYLQWEEAEDYEKTHAYNLQILDERGSVLYEYFDIGRDTMRGSLQEDHMIWVCTEQWTSPHRDYLEGWLKESDLLLIDLSDGEILFQDKAGENEFYITSNETRCYFYDPGKEESERLLGLMKIPPKNAEIYYRL